MVKNIYMVGGSKGGVGKSLLAMALLDYFQQSGKNVVLVESDTSNPDVWKSYHEVVQAVPIDLDTETGWMDFMTLCGGVSSDTIIVVNSAARSNKGVTLYGERLELALQQLGIKLVTLWIINTQRDSLELLKQYMEVVPSSDIHVLKNSYFGQEKTGEEDPFKLYNKSNIRKTVEQRGGKSLTFPALAGRVTDFLYIERMTIAEAAEGPAEGPPLPLGVRIEFLYWRDKLKKVFKEIIDV